MKRKNTASKDKIHSEDSPQTFYQKVDRMYQQEMPGVLGFFTLATPLAAIADTWRHVPAANGLSNRILITAAGLAGLQHVVAKGRKWIYDKFDVYYRSEAAKRFTDTLYGAAVGATLNPIFHGITQRALELQHSVPLKDSILTGTVVGGLTGLFGWLASDAYAHSWEVQNTPSRTINVPGAEYLKGLPKNLKKTLAIGATLLSLGGTADYYVNRHYTEQAQAISRPAGPISNPHLFNMPSLENRVSH